MEREVARLGGGGGMCGQVMTVVTHMVHEAEWGVANRVGGRDWGVWNGVDWGGMEERRQFMVQVHLMVRAEISISVLTMRVQELRSGGAGMHAEQGSDQVGWGQWRLG